MADRGEWPSLDEAPPRRAGPPDLEGRRILVLEDSVLVAAEITANLTDARMEVVGPHLDVPGALNALEWEAYLIDGAILAPTAQDKPTDLVAERLAEMGVPFVLLAGLGREPVAPVFKSAPVCRKPLMMDELFANLRTCLGGA